MALPKLTQTPDRESYSYSDAAEAGETSFGGGASRARPGTPGSPGRVSVRWTTDRAGYLALLSFFRVTTIAGALPFLIDLIVDEPYLVEAEARFVPGTFVLSGKSGHRYEVGATLEVVPPRRNLAYSEMVVLLYDGRVTGDLFTELSNFVNVVWPDIP